MQVPYNFQQVINNNQYQVINGVKCFPVSMLDENFDYLCKVVSVGTTTPAISYDGQFWFDGTTLKIAQSSSWKDIKVASAVNADKIGGLSPSQFLRSDQDTICSGGITAQQFTSTTTSAPPLVVSNNQLVTNLCADYVDGYHVDSTGAVTGQLVQFDIANVKLKPAPIYYNSANNRVGILTSSPNGFLEVANSFYAVTGEIKVYPQNTTTEGGQVTLLGAGNYGYVYIDNNYGRFRIVTPDATGESAKFTLDSNGNVAIANFVPSYKLHVAGDIAIQAGANAFIGTVDNYALSLRTNNTDRIFISSSGSVGIGTTTPGIASLNIANQGSGVGLYIGDVNTAPYGNALIELNPPSSATHIWAQEGNQVVFKVTAGGAGFFAGSVGIGIAPSYKLDVAGDIRSVSSGYVRIHPAGSDSDTSFIRLMNTASSTANPYIHFGYGSYAGICGMYMAMSDKTFRLNVSKTSDGSNLRDAIIIPPANGAQTACIIPNSGGGYVSDWPSGWGGGIATYDITCGSIYYNQLVQRSDANIKTDIQPLVDYLSTDSLDIISCLKPVKYVYVDDPLKINRFGFIAQDVSEVCPELVTIDTEGKASLNYMDLIALLTRGIQELYDMFGKVIQKIGGVS